MTKHICLICQPSYSQADPVPSPYSPPCHCLLPGLSLLVRRDSRHGADGNRRRSVQGIGEFDQTCGIMVMRGTETDDQSRARRHRRCIQRVSQRRPGIGILRPHCHRLRLDTGECASVMRDLDIGDAVLCLSTGRVTCFDGDESIRVDKLCVI